MTYLNPQLQGRPEPKGQEVRKFEQPWHRAAAYMFARGATRTEVAAACNVTPQCITHLLKNRWFQENVTAIMAEAGLDTVAEMIKGESVNTLVTMIELRDDPTTPKATRAQICQNLLDRVLGKAVQKLEVDSTVRSADPVKEAEQLAAENARLQKRLGLSS